MSEKEDWPVDASPHLTFRSQHTDLHPSSVVGTMISDGSVFFFYLKKNLDFLNC